jgi:4-amino-4-deoxy-L-arabinose transferase-like glycosyltransferase
MAAAPPHRSSTAELAIRRRRRGLFAGSRSQIFQVVLAFAIGIAVLGRGIETPFIKDAEPQSAQWIMDVVKNGHWLLPRDYYHVLNPKPPLFYWLSAILAKATGGHVDEIRARALSLLAGAALATEVMAWSAVRLGAFGGWLAFVFLLGTYGFTVRATMALTDMLLTFLLFTTYLVLMPQIEATSGAAPLARSLHFLLPRSAGKRDIAGKGGEHPSRGSSMWCIVSAGILLGLAILTKGPLAVVLLALAALIYLLLAGTNPLTLVQRGWPWAALAISIVIASAWYVPALIAGHAAKVGAIIIHENFGHFLPRGAGGTGEAARPFYYIALRMIGGALPLSLLIPAMILSCRDYIIDGRRELLYQVAMLVAVLMFFSLASAKRDDYILPALPSLAILLASQFVRGDESPRISQRLAAKFRDGAVLATAIAVILAITAMFVLIRTGDSLAMLGGRLASSDESYAAILAHGIARLDPRFIFFAGLMIIGAGAAFAGVYYARLSLTGAGFGLICIAGSTLWIGILRPIEATTRCVAGFAREVRAAAANAPIYVSHPDPEMAWYYGRELPTIPHLIAASGPPAGTRTYFVGRPGDLLTIAPQVRQRMKIIIQSHVLGGGGKTALYVFEDRVNYH